MKAKADQNLCLGIQDCVNRYPWIFNRQEDKAHVCVDKVLEKVERMAVH